MVSASAWRYAFGHDNWRKGLGTICVHGVADVCVMPGATLVDITIWFWDPFGFGYDTEGIRHLHSAGLCVDYMNEASDRHVVLLR